METQVPTPPQIGTLQPPATYRVKGDEGAMLQQFPQMQMTSGRPSILLILQQQCQQQGERKAPEGRPYGLSPANGIPAPAGMT